MQNSSFLPAVLLAAAMIALPGCAAGPASQAPASTWMQPPLAPNSAEFAVGPRAAVEMITKALAAPPISLAVESADKGVITTGYKQYPGDWHIARRWQEHTRFRISVIPDWDNPTGKCRVEVTEQTEQRATGSQPWQTAPDLQRPQRSAEVLDQIRGAIEAAR